ncbi:MAG: response regulator transcription factor [Thauera sp.]|jgi:two-component system OmpR family response regulator|nr:response regulator transcription factor [Thauera sp.]
MHILLIEDDASVADFIVRGLRENQIDVQHVADGQAALDVSRRGRFDAMIVDRMLPGLDGLSVIRHLREQGDKTPALILSALGEVDDRVQGLRAGGDDYLVKPFDFTELLARIEAVLRRQQAGGHQTRLKVADLEMDLLAHRVTRAGEELTLQPREYKLLEYLMRHAGQVVTRTMLLENVWDYHFDPQTNVIDVHISRLRQKIDRGFGAPLLTTVRGSGYMLQDQPGAAE